MMPDTPLVSVVIPAYKSAEYLKESLQSIVNQTYRNLEILVLDDTPVDDGAQDIIQKLNDSRIRYIKSEKRLGLVRSINKGIRLSKGLYIARMDTDDIAHKERIERQVNYLLTHRDVGIVGSSCYTVDSHGHLIGYISFPAQDAEIKAKLLFNSAFVHSSVVIRRDLLMRFPYNESCSCCEDYELWTRLAAETHFHNLDEKLVKYRLISQSAMSSQLQRLKKDNDYYLKHTAILRMAYDNILSYYGTTGNELHQEYTDLLFAKKIKKYSIRDREIFLRQCQKLLAANCPEAYLRRCIAYQWIKMTGIRFWQTKNIQWFFDALKELVAHAALTAKIWLFRLSRIDRDEFSWRL